MKDYDVYSYGMVSSSTLYAIKGDFPDAEGYAELDGVRYMAGGEATNSSIVLSCLGASVRLGGNWLGDNDDGRRTLAILDRYDIDTSGLSVKPGYRGVEEVVFAARDTRTIFGTYGRLQEEQAWDVPNNDDISSAKVVCLDPFLGEASLAVARLADEAGKAVITVDCLHDSPLLAHCSALVVAGSFLLENYADSQMEDIFRMYQHSTRGLVVFTFGDREIWFAGNDDPRSTYRPYSIDPVDTTGGGDSFRAGVVYGLLQGWGHHRTIDFAAAVAAIVCTRFPGVLNAPGLDEVFAFMKSHEK